MRHNDFTKTSLKTSTNEVIDFLYFIKRSLFLLPIFHSFCIENDLIVQCGLVVKRTKCPNMLFTLILKSENSSIQGIIQL